MADTNEKMYRNLSEIGIEELERLMRLLKDVKVDPADLFAYAIALDTVTEHAEVILEEDCSEATVEGVLEEGFNVEVDDPSLVEGLYAAAKQCLVKMGKIDS